MAQFRFQGDPNDDYSGPDTIEWDGYVFSRNDWTEVPDDRCAKLRGNSHFVERVAVAPVRETTSDDGSEPVEAPKRRGRPPKAQG